MESLGKLLFLSLAGLTTVSILSLISLYSLREAGWWRNHTHLVIEQIDTLEQSMTRAAAWYQMYQFTGDTGGLWRCEKEISEAQGHLGDLQRLTRDNDFQHQRIKRLNSLLKSWSQASNASSDPSRPFAKLVPTLHEMRRQEKELLSLRAGEMELVRETSFYLNCGLLIFSLVSLLFLWRKWNQENVWTTAVVKKLVAAEERFQAFMNHSPLLAFIRDADSQLIYSNKAWQRFTSGSPPQHPGEPSARDMGEYFRNHDEEILTRAKPLTYLEQVTTRDNTTCEWLVVKFPFSPDGRSTLVGGLAMDVTEARRTERALQESEERLRLVMQAASMQVWEIDVEKNEVYAKSANFESLSTEDLSFRRLPFDETLQFVSPEYRQEVKEKISNAIANRSSYQAIYRTVFGRWTASFGTVQLDESNRPIRMIGFMQDQTEKIEAERSLAELRKLHDSILKCAHVALISIDKNRKVMSWNPAAERLVGYSAEEVVGRATPDLWHDPAEVEAHARELGLKGYLHRDPFLSQALLRGEDTQECTFTRKDGSRVPVRLTITPIFADDGGLIGFLKHASDISELRRAAHQIHELSQALQDTVSGWAKLDVEGRYMGVNKAYARIAGYSAEELIGLPWQRTVYPDDLPVVTQAYQNMLALGKGEARARGLRKDGSVFNEELFLAQARDHLGILIGSYCFMRDITARVVAEQKLEASERRYRELFELNPLPGWIYDPRTLRFLDVNEAAVRHYGYTREQLLSMKVADIRVPEETELIERELGRFTRLPSWTSGPWHHRLRDGTVIEVEIAARNLSETARLVVIRDVTEQRQAEVLRRSEAKLQEAQHIARLGSWELDTKSGAVSWSPETYRIFGLQGAAGKFLYEEFLKMVHPEDRQQVASAVAESVQKKQVYDLQFRILRQDGELRHIHGRGQFSNGSRQCLAGTMLDITEEKRAQDALQQSLQEKEVLIKEIHHRVKNNLQVISCLLSMQAVAVKEQGAVAALLESERRVMAMAAIHERLYGHKRMDRINFCEYAKSLVEDLIGSYASSGSQIDGRYSIAPVELHIEQAIPCGLILNELITNCLKYAYPAGGQGSIFVSLQQIPDQKLSLSVADHGPGLPENFDWKKSKSLGVTIVNLLTKQLGGALQIESSPAGTAFTVIFPKVS